MSFVLKRIKINYFINTIGKLSLMHNTNRSAVIDPYFKLKNTALLHG